MTNISNLLGVSSEHISFEFCEVPLHNALKAAVTRLKMEAKNAGFDLKIISGFRSFEKQKDIWNQKALGKRPLLNALEDELDVRLMSEREIVFAILRWTALPGASRHHWGTDMDVFDASSLGDQKLNLSVSETRDGGVFEAFYIWLDAYLASGANDFYRPYREDLGGVSPEPWHLSFKPLAVKYRNSFSKIKLKEKIMDSNICFNDVILENFNEIYERFVLRESK